jgi:hypothetical protein
MNSGGLWSAVLHHKMKSQYWWLKGLGYGIGPGKAACTLECCVTD